MSSSIEAIGHKLQSLEEQLQAANEISSNSATMRQTSRNLQLQMTPSRSRRMYLPVTTATPAAETDTDKKLKAIMKQTGILTINGQQYPTNIQDLEHLGDLGNGTSGNVVKMCHVNSGTIIAVKQMRRTGNTEENKRILMDLDVVLKSHDCPYIVQCLGCFVRDPDVWICMELMSMCFDKLLKSSKKPVPEYILGKVTVATVKALSYLKDKHNVIHRDVKPSNILIDERGNIKLCDFGISGRLVDSKANTRSAGCAAYMAPERIDPKKPKYDIRADVWSVGITLVELATARSPYEGCNTDFEVLTKVLESEPPTLPHGDGFNFSKEFHDFVSKCLTKNHLSRPKYPELLEQPFIKYYESAQVDVPKWFKDVVETSGIKTHHRTTMPTTRTSSGLSKLHINGAPILANTKSSSARVTHIPSYQHYETTDPLSQLKLHRNHLKQDDHKLLQLPQTNTNYLNSKHMQHVDRAANTNEDVIHYVTSANSVTISKSNPQSPLGADYNLNKHNICGTTEKNKFYQRSPLLSRKLSNGSLKYNTESPKKESILSSLGQSIIRNLPTSPFSQKKSFLPQSNQIDPFWHPTSNDDIGLGFDGGKVKKSIHVSMLKEKSLNNQNQTNSANTAAKAECSPQRVHGNQSPIVLQRFYHQQNQLREKDMDRQPSHPIYHSRFSPDTSTVNNALGNYQTGLPTSSYDHYNYQQQRFPQSHIPIATSLGSASSSHSTSSQSSTQSSSSQIVAYEQRLQSILDASSVKPIEPSTAALAAFGIGKSIDPLQYQPLPQQYIGPHCLRNVTSATTSDRGLPEDISNISDISSNSNTAKVVDIKPSKLNVYRASPSTFSSVPSSSHDLRNIGIKENNIKDDNGWFNSFAGAMKRQFASYVKLQLNSSAPIVPIETDSGTGITSRCSGSVTNAHKSTGVFRRGMSLGNGSGKKLNSPQNEIPKSSMMGDEFYDCSNTPNSYLRRGTNPTTMSPNIGMQNFAALDRRHRSPDPPPRYNRGQSPLLLRKNILELSGQSPGSPFLNRRYVSASPPLPPPRRGTESVPGSPQHFRTRIHYTPEPQRRIYRTIDQ